MNFKELQIDKILEQIRNLEYIKPEDIPGIDLYMDQVTTFMDQHLEGQKRYPDDKILTKTMINNYAKNNLLPPPNKKKYSREHMLLLIFIYYFKNMLSISDIQTLLQPLTDSYFGKANDKNLESIYSEIFSIEKDSIEKLLADIKDKFESSQQQFVNNADENQKNYLQTFSFICMLSFDVYLKKQIIESLIDDFEREDKTKKK